MRAVQRLFVLLDHGGRPQSQPPRVLPPVLDVARPQHHSDQLAVCILKVNAQTATSSRGDPCFDARKPRHCQEAVTIVPGHRVLNMRESARFKRRFLNKVRRVQVRMKFSEPVQSQVGGALVLLCVYDLAEDRVLHRVR